MPNKTLVLGLDMGDGALIRRWAEAGHLTTFARMIKNGKWIRLETPANVLHVSAWPSLYTGVLPGEHGVYYTFQPQKDSQIAKRIGIGQYGKPPIWKLLDHAGLKCIVMDAPYTFPEEEYHGIQIFEWGTWGWYWQPMSRPADLWKKFENCCGSYPLGFEANQIGLKALNLEKLRNRLVASAASKANAAAWLLSEYSWDFAWIVFGETHPAGHYLRNFDRMQSGASEFCLDVYQTIDSAIGQILKNQEDDTSVIVVSGDGVGPNYAGWHLLPNVLQETGYLVKTGQPPIGPTDGPAQGDRPKKDWLKQVRGLVPSNLRQTVSKRLPASLREKLMARWESSEVDWHRTRAFCLPTDLEGCIRINLKGREPEGIVEPGEEYRRLCEEIAHLMTGLIDDDTGRRVVKSVYKIYETFPGARQNDLPDIIVHWENQKKINSIRIPASGIRVDGESPDQRTGTHISPGFMLGYGDRLSNGLILSGNHVVDLAPTILQLMNVTVPAYMQGRVGGAR